MANDNDDPAPPRKLGGVFANALASTPRHMAQAAPARATVLTCAGCGAPRVDGSDSTSCAFCGGHMILRTACTGCGAGLPPEAAFCPSCGGAATP